MTGSDFVDWTARRSEWNMQPRFWETEAGSKKIISALKAIATVAMTFGLMAPHFSFSATVVIGLGIIATFALFAMVQFNKRDDFWKDPDYCVIRGQEVLDNFYSNIKLNDHTDWDYLEEPLKKSIPFAKGVIKLEDFQKIRSIVFKENE